MNEHTEWQRTTALAKVERDRAAFAEQGTPISDPALAARAGAYVGVATTLVERWMKGEK